MRANASTRLVFLGPALTIFALVWIVPMLAVVGLAFASWTGYDLHQIQWNGVGNFQDLIHDSAARRAFFHTATFVVLLTVLGNVIGLGIALLLNTQVRGSNLLRVALLVPLALSPVITAILWQFLLGPYGFLNQLLQAVGLSDSPIGFFGDPQLAFATIVAATVWQGSGVSVLILYAALRSLPHEKLEAAAIDGAGFWSRIRWIVLPHLRPALAVSIVLSLIFGWKVFDLVFVLTAGGPNGATEVLGTMLYRQAFEFSNIGYASVLALLTAALAIVSTVVRKPIAGDQYA